MDLEKMVPIVIYDNACHLCIKFANTVNFLARGRITLVGHYTEMGERLREKILYPDATEMFWFIDGKTAHGGRAALLPVISSFFKTKKHPEQNPNKKESCVVGCKKVKAVFVRSASLLTNSKKIKIS